mmetsp:Transcript_6688/g.29464  ORF Transcript_6688/g.29464 Transcript_6688/m.29464 type:complete len:340 (+) Transcript_6688:291-1310(+)
MIPTLSRFRNESPRVRVSARPCNLRAPRGSLIPCLARRRSRSSGDVTRCSLVKNLAPRPDPPGFLARPNATWQSPAFAVCTYSEPVLGSRHASITVAAQPSYSQDIAASHSANASARIRSHPRAPGVLPPKSLATDAGRDCLARTAASWPPCPSNTAKSATCEWPRSGHSARTRSSILGGLPGDDRDALRSAMGGSPPLTAPWEVGVTPTCTVGESVRSPSRTLSPSRRGNQRLGLSASALRNVPFVDPRSAMRHSPTSPPSSATSESNQNHLASAWKLDTSPFGSCRSLSGSRPIVADSTPGGALKELPHAIPERTSKRSVAGRPLGRQGSPSRVPAP